MSKSVENAPLSMIVCRIMTKGHYLKKYKNMVLLF